MFSEPSKKIARLYTLSTDLNDHLAMTSRVNYAIYGAGKKTKTRIKVGYFVRNA